MAQDGVLTWAEGVAEYGEKLSSAVSEMMDLATHRVDFGHVRRRFQRDRHFILNAAHMLLQYRKWAEQTDALPADLFSELDEMKSDITSLRHMNEHVIEYFCGVGRRPDEWVHESPETGTSDASATFETLIGGRLDWRKLTSMAENLAAKIRALTVKYSSAAPSA